MIEDYSSVSTPGFTPAPFDPGVLRLLERYPPALFTPRLHYSMELIQRYARELAGEVLERLGVRAALATWRTPEALCRALGFAPAFRGPLAWLLEQALLLGRCESEGAGESRRYRIAHVEGSDLQALRKCALEIDAGNAATLDLLDRAAALYPAVARAEVNAEQALFQPEAIALWLAYFSNDNPTYTINNWTAAVAATDRVAGRSRLRLLEIGAGAGSGTAIVLEALAARGLMPRLDHYLVTEPSPFFLRRAQRELARRYRGAPLAFRPLDINLPWSDQGVDSGAFDLVIGVNVMHVARDLSRGLGEARRALAEGGWLVIGECLKATPHAPVFPELVFQILESFTRVETDERLRPRAGFLTAHEWCAAFAQCGFARTEVEPDMQALAAACPNFIAGAVCGQNVGP